MSSAVDPTDSGRDDPAYRTTRGGVSMRLLVLSCALVGMVRLAWISDDSLITLRTSLNWANGWGPAFNAAESVQAYTHPTWFLLWTVLGRTTGEWILTITATSIAFAAVAFFLALTRGRNAYQVLAVATALLMSNAFMEYAASGLENSLAYAVTGVLVLLTATHSADRSGARHALTVGLLLAVLALTRLDLLILAAPPGAVYAWKRRDRARTLVRAAMGAAIPLAVWFTWTYFQYAAFLPNTFAAKRNIDIPVTEAVIQGFRYIRISAVGDPGTPAAAAVAVAVVVALGTRAQRAWAVGSGLYLAYVVWISGDFMVGRFLAVPFYVLVIVAGAAWSEGRGGSLGRTGAGRFISRPRVLAIMSGVGMVLAMSVAGRVPVSLSPHQGERWDFGTHAGIADERGIQFDRNRGVLQSWRSGTLPLEPFDFQAAAVVDLGASLTDVRAAARSWPRRPQGRIESREVGVRCGNLGIAGIVSGPKVHWIDPCGLTDRFLAEQVFSARDFRWRVGHYARALPPGYEEAVRLNDPSQLDDDAEAVRLADLWARIRR